MNRTELATIYDSFPESQQNMPKAEFIRKALDAYNPAKNRKILSAMVERKCQIKAGQMEQATIDAALRRGK